MSLGASVIGALFISYSGYAVALLSNIIVSRLLGVQGKGAFSLFIETTYALILFSSFGIGNGQIYQSSKDPDTLKHFMPNSYFFAVVLGGGVAAVYYLAALLLDFKAVAGLTPSLVVMGVLAVPVMNMGMFQRQYLLTVQSYRMAKTNGVLSVAIPLCFYWLMYALDLISVDNFIFSFVVGQVVCFLLFLAHFSKITPEGQSVSLDFAKKTAAFGTVQYLGDLCSYLNRRLDFFLVFWFLGAPGLGIYSVAVALAETTSRLSHELGTILFPVFASDALSETKPAAILRMTTMFIVLIAFFLELASRPIVLLLFGEQFSEAIACFQVLLVGTVALATVDVTWNHAMASGRPGLGIPIFGFAAVLDTLLNLFLIPRMGLMGASISATISYCFAASVLIWLFCRGGNYSISEALLVRLDDVRKIVKAVKGLPRTL